MLKERDEPSATGNKKAPAPVSSLDKLIDNLKGPKVISTVTKSSTDWSTYKEKEGIEDEALTKAKDGYFDTYLSLSVVVALNNFVFLISCRYLAKQDFLVDCDLAAFEKEKAIRESRRMKQS